MISLVALFVFPLLMAYAASSDLLTMRIANWLVAVQVVAYLVLALFAGLPLDQVGISVAAAVIVLAFAFAFFAFGWIGGGDAKLVAATTLWVGFGMMFQYLIYAALLGGGLTFLILVLRRYPLPPALQKQRWLDRLHNTKSGVPYGIALAIAALLVYPDTAIFAHFAN